MASTLTESQWRERSKRRNAAALAEQIADGFDPRLCIQCGSVGPHAPGCTAEADLARGWRRITAYVRKHGSLPGYGG